MILLRLKRSSVETRTSLFFFLRKFQASVFAFWLNLHFVVAGCDWLQVGDLVEGGEPRHRGRLLHFLWFSWFDVSSGNRRSLTPISLRTPPNWKSGSNFHFFFTLLSTPNFHQNLSILVFLFPSPLNSGSLSASFFNFCDQTSSQFDLTFVPLSPCSTPILSNFLSLSLYCLVDWIIWM